MSLSELVVTYPLVLVLFVAVRKYIMLIICGCDMWWACAFTCVGMSVCVHDVPELKLMSSDLIVDTCLA